MGTITHTIKINADTNQAKITLQELQSQLHALASVPVSVDASGLQSAKTSILELGQSLRAAMNPNTGKLDLSVFSRELKASNKTILDYKNALFSMGTQGQQAFLSLANAIASAEAPTNRLNQRVLQFGKTLKNTINWQLSSSLIHGIVGSFQKAINYAEKLNTSLNNIQIVTGQNNEKMAEFAKQANQTAKQLSTTTTEYTNASLIYYQQGLSDKEVAKRTETTLKLANVTRQSAQTVSDQMTAIWNNYAEGSDNLEHYADVITALGAATAASSAEIAGGLEKFAAVSKTVGLSYNYATTALATIVATTRQSEDTVGTGLRTIFSRLESLKLGETLEDGVGLTKYSAALKIAGVEVLDQYGAVKDMDKILDELGAKWKTISREQQIALAQTVGGVRQYTNLMALMNNWDKFQKNLKVAEGADGTLQTQEERYATSWEAARKRVQTSAEGIYDSLIDDQAIIKVTNVFAGFLDVVNGLVDGFGGLKVIIPTVLALLANNAAKNMPQFLGDIGNNIRVFFGRSQKDMTNIQGSLGQTLRNMQLTTSDPIERQKLQKIIDTNDMNRSLAMNARRMSDADQAAYRFQIAAREAEHDATITALQRSEQAKQAYNQLNNLSYLKAAKIITAKDLTEAEVKAITDRVTDNERMEQLTEEVNSKFDAKRQKALDKAEIDYQRDQQKILKEQEALRNEANQLNQAYQKRYPEIQEAHVANQNRLNELNGLLNEQELRKKYPNLYNELDAARREQLLQETSNPNSAEARAAQSRTRAAEAAIDNALINGVTIKDLRKEQARLLSSEQKLNDETKKLTDGREQAVELNRKANQKSEELTQLDAEYTKTKKELNDAADTELESYLTDAAKKQAIEDELKVRNEQVQLTKTENLGKLLSSNDQTFYDALPQEYKDLLSGKGIDEEGKKLIEFNEANLLKMVSRKDKFISSQDRDLFDQISKIAYQNFDKVKMQEGALKASTKDVDLLNQELNTMLTDQISPDKMTQFATDFITNMNAGLKEAGVTLDLSELLKNANFENSEGVQQFINNIKEKIKHALEENGAKTTDIERILHGAGFDVSGKQHKDLGDSSQRKGVEDYYKGRTGEPTDNAPKAKPTKSISTSLTQIASAATTLYSAFQTASNAVQTFSDNTTTGLQRFGAALSTITSTLMAGGVTGNALKGVGVSEKYSGWIGLAISIIMALIGKWAGNQEVINQAVKKAQGEKMTKADQAIEQITASSELISSQQNLINAYNQTANDLKRGQASQKDLENAKQALVKSLLETANGYSNSNATAAALNGNTVEVQRIIDQNRLRDLESKEIALQAGKDAAEEVLLESKDHKNGLVEDIAPGLYYFDYSTGGSLDTGSKEEQAAQAILKKSIGRFGYKSDITGMNTVIKNTLALETAEDVVEYYNTLVDILSQMDLVGANEQNSKVYRSVKAQKDAYADAVENYQKYATELNNSNIERMALGGMISGRALSVQSGSRTLYRANDIQTVQDYDAFRDQLIAYIKDIEQIQENTPEYKDMLNRIDAYLGTVPAVLNHEQGNLQYISKGIENIVNDQVRYNYDNNLSSPQLASLKTNVQTLYEQYGDAIFGWNFTIPIPITPIANTETDKSLQQQLELIQAKAAASKIKTAIEITTDFDLDLQSSYKDIAKFVRQMNESLDPNNPNGKGAWETYSSSHEKLNLAEFFALPSDERAALIQQVNMAAQADYYSATGGLQQELTKAQALQTTLEHVATAAADAYNSIINPEIDDIEGYKTRDIINNEGVLRQFFDKDTLKESKTAIVKALKESDYENDRLLGAALETGEDDEYIQLVLNRKAAYDAATAAAANNAAQMGELNEQAEAYKANGFRIPLLTEAEAWKIDYDSVQEYAQILRDTEEWQNAFADAQDNIAQASERAALSILTTENAIDNISTKYKEWSDLIKNSEPDGLKQLAIYEDMADNIKQLLTPTKNVTRDFAKFADKMGYVYKAGKGNKEAILSMGKALWAYNNLSKEGQQAFDDEVKNLTTEAELRAAQEKLLQDGTKALEEQYQKMQATTSATEDLATITQFLETAQEGQILSTEAQAAAQRLYAAEFQQAIDQGMSAPEALQAASDALNAIGADMPTPELKTLEAGDSADIERQDIIAIPDGNDGVTYQEGKVTTVKNESSEAVSYLDWSGKGGGSAQTPTNHKSKGGGGGGGKKEPHKPKRYRNIENQIQNNKRKMDVASRNKDRAVGTAKLEYLEKERELREENLKLEQQYQKEIEDWLDKDRDKMMEAFAAINFTPIFDEAGEVINNDAFELAFEAIGDGSDEAWKKAEEALAQYEETLDKLNDKLEEIQELQDAIYDAALEATKLKLDLQLDVSIDRFEYLDYLLDKIDDDAYQAAEAIALLGDKTAETMKKVNTYTTGLEDILSRHGFSLSDLDNLSVEDLNAAGFTQSEIDQIKEWRSELLKANQDLLEMRKTIIDKVINAFDNLNEKVQKSYDKFNAYNSVLEKYKNITDLMGRNMSAQSRQIMNQLSNTMLRNAQNTAAAARRIYEDAEMEMAQAQLAYQLAVSSGDQEAIRRWQEVIDATSEHLQEAEEQWLESWNNALEQAKTMFEDMMEQIQEDYSATMGSTFGSLDYLQAAYDRQKEIGEMYERDFDRLYDLSKLSRDISKAIDDNDNIKGKQKLRALQAEINKLQADGTRLSEYDVEVLRKKFELEQARLALDDAQNAKSQVRLQRDANGNWGYVYTANEDKIEEAEQAYEDKLHEYQVLNDDYINQLQDKALEVQQTWSEVVGEIYSDLGLGVITDEEAATRLEEANRWLNEQRAYFEEQSNHALENQASLYDRTLNTYHVASAEIVDTWGETNLALLTKIDELQAYMNNWNEASETFLSHSAEVIDKYKEDIDKINDMAGISTTKFENHIDNVVVNINDMSDDTLTSVNDLSETMRNEFSSALSEAVNWELQYVDAMDAMINRNETFVKSLNLMIEKLAGVNTSITEMLTPLETLDNIINQSTTPVYYQNSLSELTGTSAQHILSLLNANIAAYSAGLGELSMSGVNGLTTTIDQNVTINAAFPNATNHSEIEEAFTNLINKASQYANRKGL